MRAGITTKSLHPQSAYRNLFISAIIKHCSEYYRNYFSFSIQVMAVLTEGDFSNFPLSKKLISRLKARGVTELFPVQYKTFNEIYSGQDAVVLAR